MSSPIIVNGSTTVISVRATDFTYDEGKTAVVILSSINSFGRMITIFDEDGYVGGPDSRKIKISTSLYVSFDSRDGDYVLFLTQKNQSLSVFPRTLNQWVLPQSVITSQYANSGNNNRGTIVNATDFNSLTAEMVAISTNLEVYGSTISGTQFTINTRIRTSFTQDSLSVRGIQSLQTSTGAVTVKSIGIDNTSAFNLETDNLLDTDYIQASSFSTFVQRTSSLTTRVITIADNSTGIPSVFSLNNLSTLWNGSNIPYETASTFSTGLLYYSTGLKLVDISYGLSSISSFIPNSISSIAGAATLSSYSTAFMNLVNSINYGPGVSSFSTMVSPGLSSVFIGPSLSTLSTVISQGLSSVYFTPGLSSLYDYFSLMLSSVATNSGLSTLSTSISLGLSTVNTSIAFSNVSTLYSIGVSDIANHTGISSLSSMVPFFFSSLILQEGVSSLSTFIFSTVSSLVVGPGLSSLSTTTGNYYSTLNSPYGLSSLSTTLSGLSTQSVSQGLSSLSSVFGYNLSTVSVFGTLSSISTTVQFGLVNVYGNEGISSLSTFINSVASSLNTSQGASSLHLFIKNQFSTFSDQEGLSSLSSFIGPAFSSIVTSGGGFIQTPANLSTLILNTCTFTLWDSTNSVYRSLYLSASKLYLDNTLVDNFVLQSTSRSTIGISTYNINITGLLNTSTLMGTSLFLDPSNDFGFSSFARDVSTGLLTTSSITTSSINFLIGTKSLSFYSSNNDLYFNGSTITNFSSLGTSSFSTSMSVLSSLSHIVREPFTTTSYSNISTSLSLGASTLNYSQGVSTLSTLFTQLSTVDFFPGISTNNFFASTAFVSTISSYGQLSSFLRVNILLNVSTLIASTLIASNADIKILDLSKSFASSFKFFNNNSASVSTLSTSVNRGISSGFIEITSRTASTLVSSMTANISYFSSIVLSTLFIPNSDGTNPAPLFVSSGTIWFDGKNIANTFDPNNLTSYMFALSTASLYTSTLLVSSFQYPTIIKVSDKMTVIENVQITQSSLSMYNRSVFSTFIDPDANEPTQYFDTIQYSTDGISWKTTNWFQSSISGGINRVLGKPSYNGSYWLVGNQKNTSDPDDPDYPMNQMDNFNNSIMYSANGYQYYGLENNQFDLQAIQPTWNGQYWLAGDLFTTTPQKTIKRSFDGLVWTSGNSGGFYGGCFNFGWNGSLWVAVGRGGDEAGDEGASINSNSNVQYSTDGLNWLNAQGSLPDNQGNCVLFDGKKWIVGGQSNVSLAYSSDGMNWLTSPIAGFFYDIAFNGKIYVATGEFDNDNYGLAYSYDGINWTYNNAFLPPPYNDDFPLGADGFSVIWSGDKFVATGSNTFIGLSGVYSYDGLTWIPTDSIASYRYIRFTAFKTFGTGGQQYAIGPFKLRFNGADISYDPNVTAYAVTYGTTINLGIGTGDTTLNIIGNILTNKYFPFLPGSVNGTPASFIIDNKVSVYFDAYRWATADYQPRNIIRWTVEGSTDYVNWTLLSDKSGADQTITGQNTYQGPFTLDNPIDPTVFESVDWGQGVGFSSNILPALETNNLKIYTMSKGYIPLHLTSTNHWQVTPTSIIMNNNFTISKELNTGKHVGIGTPYPLATLDIVGTMQANNSSFFSSIVVGSSFGYNGSTQTAGYVPTFDVSIFGSSLMNSLVINTPNTISRRGPLDVYSPDMPIINRGAYVNLSTVTSTLVTINQVAAFPQTGRQNGLNNNIVRNDILYWVWNNGPAQQQSSLYFAISGTAPLFTGQHACYVSSVTQENVSSFVGLIATSQDQGYVSVSLDGNVTKGSNAIYSTESLPYLTLASSDMEKGVFGVISDKANLPAAVNFSTMNAYNLDSGFRNSLFGRLLINGVGDGALWTTNVNGNVSIGDYLCSSHIPGHARVQDDPTGMYNYTVAKATMNCDFDLNSSKYRCETIDFNGSTFVRAFVGCTYHCG